MKFNQRGEACYCSFQELAEAYKLKPVSKTTSDTEKLKSQQEKFLSRHQCRGCNQPMSWIGDNILTCTNPQCRGIKIKSKNEDGMECSRYITSYHLLDDVSAEIANNIFSKEI